MDEIEKNVTNSRERIADISVTVWENLNSRDLILVYYK
jgi:hypothetical protein